MQSLIKNCTFISLSSSLLEDLEAARNHILEHSLRVVLLTDSLELCDIVGTPASVHILRDVGVILIDEVDEVTTRSQDCLLLFDNVGHGSLNIRIVGRVGIGGRHEIHHVVGLTGNKAEHVSAIGNGLWLCQELEEHALHIDERASAVLPDLE